LTTQLDMRVIANGIEQRFDRGEGRLWGGHVPCTHADWCRGDLDHRRGRGPGGCDRRRGGERSRSLPIFDG
jgi:hypothetical protein